VKLAGDSRLWVAGQTSAGPLEANGRVAEPPLCEYRRAVPCR